MLPSSRMTAFALVSLLVRAQSQESRLATASPDSAYIFDEAITCDHLFSESVRQQLTAVASFAGRFPLSRVVSRLLPPTSV